MCARFGAFEADFHAGELRKHGVRLKLHDQPFQVLTLLVSRPGELITREEIHQKLWPSGTFVDFENGLNSAVNRLREALGDSACEPKFIETVPRRGYRFIVPVERVCSVLSMLSLEGNKPILGSEAIPAYKSQVTADGDASLECNSTEPRPEAKVLPAKRRWNAKLLLIAGVVLPLALGATVAVLVTRDSQLAASSARRKLSVTPIVTYADGGPWLPAFSPDGTRVAYSWSVGDEFDFSWYLEVKILGSDTRLRLTTQPAASPPGPAWSPDGSKLVFARTSALENRGIFIVSALGGPEKKLRSLAPWGVALQRMVSWSPDGRWIAFSDKSATVESAKHTGAGPNAIYLISPETLETRQLTTPAANELGDAAPTFSPDSESIAFIHTNVESKDEICTIATKGGIPHKLVTDGLWTNGLTWSADGKSIVYDRSYVGGFSLWTVHSWGGEPHQLDTPIGAMQPNAWRDRLAYEAREGVGTVGRVPLNRLYTELPETPVASTRHDHAGRYSPQGDRIAFITDRTGADELWIADTDGSSPRQLTHFGVPLFDLSWAPDGSAIAICTVSGKVYLVPVGPGSSRQIFDGPVNSSDIDPDTIAFSRDGKFIYVMNHPGNEFALLKVPVNGGAPVKILDGLCEKFVESADGSTLFFSRPKASNLPGAPGIWKMALESRVEHYVMPTPSRLWDLGPDAIYLVNYATAQIEKYSLSGRRIQNVAKFGKFSLGNRISVSPDNRWVLFDYNQHSSVEIEMVENFR